jgi:DNA-binding CsgD family transcriptional regulator
MRLDKSYGETLSIRESEVLDLLSKGHLNKEIAVLLGVGIRTIDTHVYSIFKKLNVKIIFGLFLVIVLINT